MRPRGRFLAIILVLLLHAAPAPCQDRSVKEHAHALKHSDSRVRLAGLSGLASAGAEAAPHVETIARLLKDPSVQVRRAAAQVLSAIGEDAEKAAPHLAAALRDSDAAVRHLALQALIDLGPSSLPALEGALKGTDPNVRMLAVSAIDAIAVFSPEAATRLATALKDGNPKVRLLAVASLARFGVEGKEGEEALEGLSLALLDKNANVRNAAAVILLEMDRAASIPPILKALESKTPDVRRTAAQALVFIGEEMDAPAVLALRAALEDGDARVRQYAAVGLARAGVKARELGEGKKLVDALFKLMSDKQTAVRRNAVFALGHVGVDDEEEVKQLAKGMKDAQAVVRGFTAEALAQYSHDEAPDDWRRFVLTFIAEGLKDRDRRVALASARILVGEKAHSVPGLIQIVETATGSPRILAAYVLAEIGEAAMDAVPALQKMSKEGSAENRRAALLALQKIVP